MSYRSQANRRTSVLRFLRDHNGFVTVTYGDGKPRYSIEPGGLPVGGAIISDMLKLGMIEAENAGLVPGFVQTYRLTAKMR